MARVNHKLVRQRLNEKRSQITDRQFFTSRLLAGHFEDMAAAQTRRYHYNRRVRVNLYWKPKAPEVAMTDNLQVRINTGNPIVTKTKGREERYQIVCGLFAHELGHILYTDFLADQTYHNRLENNIWFPEPPDLKTAADIANEADFWKYIKEGPANRAIVHYISHQIANVLEDGYIENKMLNNFPGTLGYGLECLRETHFTQIPTVTELKESEENGDLHLFESIMQMILSYAKFGEIKYGEEPLSDERIQTVFGLIPEIDNAVLNSNARDRLKAVNTILIRCWESVKELCETIRKKQEEAEASGGGGIAINETIAAVCKTLAGDSGIASGNSSPVPDVSGKTDSSPTEEQRNRTRRLARTASSEENNENAESESEAEASAEEAADSKEATPPAPLELDSDDTGECLHQEKMMTVGKQEVSNTETDRIPFHQTEKLSAPLGGTIEKNEDYHREMYDRAASDIERLLENMAERAACTELENERLQELNDAAQSISYGDIHSGVSIVVNRIAEVDEELVDQYNSISAQLLTISRQLQKSLIRQLKDSRRGGKQTGLLMGRRLDAHALHRNDGKVFYKNALPNEIPELAVGLLLDESGSMCGYDRCTYARASAIILYDFCRSLDIPIMVYGHSTSYRADTNTVDLFSYAEFEGYDNDDKYRMMDISARGSNRDGAALRFVADQLSKRPEQIKLLILVSDGQPADYGYSGSAAEEDLRGIKQEYQRKGVLLIAAAIGSDKENIERIYGDSYLDITDLTQLPVKLTNIVKRHIRV